MISVIIPVYNTKDYLEKCIVSVVSQTYKDLEIILIDDCSNDGSSELLDNWATKDKRIIVIHKEKNEGVSAARNTGLLHAKGEFIGFVDSDDWIEPEMYEQMYKLIEESNADIVIGGLTQISGENKNNILPDVDTGTVLSPDDAILKCMPQIGDGYYNLYLWNKLFRRSAVQDNGMVMFDPALSFSEDVVWLITVLLKMQRAVFWKACAYIYCIGREGNSWSFVKRNDSLALIEKGYIANKQVYELLKDAHSKAAWNAYQRLLSFRKRMFLAAWKSNDTITVKKYSRHYLRDVWNWYLGNKTSNGLKWCIKQTISYALFSVKKN